LQDQTLAALSEPQVPTGQSNPREFDVVLSGGLDLFGRMGACVDFGCRVNYGDQIARTIALMADRVSVHDFLGDRILDSNRPTNAELDQFLDEVRLLHRLRPLISNGLLGFRSPMLALCSGCASEFERRVSETSRTLYAELGGSMKVVRHPDGSASIHTGILFDPNIVVVAHSRYASENSDEQLLVGQIYEAVRHTLWDARDASWRGGTLFSNSKVGLSGLLSQEGRFQGSEYLRALEGHRAAQLPWVSGLTVEQTLQLREEAAIALPRLREFLARHLAARPHDGSHPTQQSEYIHELREQAAEVRAELQMATTRSPSLARNTIGILGLGIAALGFATEVAPALVLTPLLTTLGLLHKFRRDDSNHEGEAMAKPGYVLVAAEQILAHAEPAR
jgi:hypothetical protein